MQRKTKRDQMTSKMRKSTLFRYRIVITMPPWGVLVMGAGIAIGLFTQPMLITNIVAVICALFAVVFIYVARRSLNALRHDVHEALNNIGNDEIETAPYEVPAETIRLKKMGHTNGTRSSRISE